jgi:diguanylate cyclase (GGDEF)-like protein
MERRHCRGGGHHADRRPAGGTATALSGARDPRHKPAAYRDAAHRNGLRQPLSWPSHADCAGATARGNLARFVTEAAPQRRGPAVGGHPNDVAHDIRRARLEALAVAACLLIAVGAGTLGMWMACMHTVRENFRQHLIELAESAAQQIDVRLHARIRNPEQIDGPEYRQAVEPLRRLRLGIPGIKYVYTLVRSGPTIRFILDAADPGDNDGDGIEDRSQIWEISHNKTHAIQLALPADGSAGAPAATDEPYTDPWGTFMTGYAPFYDAPGHQAGAVGVDLDAAIYVARMRTARNLALLGLLPAGALILAFSFAFYRTRLRGLAALRSVATAARRDRLTGLANRTLFMSRLEHALQSVRADAHQRFAVLFLDFDHFKMLNDTLGHEAGDELLRQIAARLRATLRSGDAISDDSDRDAEGDRNIVARFGGDEFVILLNDLHADTDVARITERLLNSLSPPYNVGGREVHSTVSIGIVTSDQCLESGEAIIRSADVAMYEAKRCGRACSVVFNESMSTRLTRHVTIESGLRKALGTTQLSLVYQPIVELASGRVTSVEALLRWQHPQLGSISPAEFVPVAEESGLIVPLGEWVLQQACRAFVAWRGQDPVRAPHSISVNLSRAELALGPRLLERIRDTLARCGMPAACLQLEVTEREVMRDPLATRTLMHELRRMQVRLAMDDFGTGTSSLACLRDYPFDAVKIDRSFVSDLVAQRDVLALIHATLTLVENLGKISIAEGVETTNQLAILQSLGCGYAQGYFFSRPVAAEALLEACELRWRPEPALAI